MNTQTVIFSGGCFWCTEHDLRAFPGVTNVVSGYTGGSESTARYTEVVKETTGHRESVLVTYDSELTSFKKICQFFLGHIDPTDAGGQFADRGESYRTAIYYDNKEEQAIAESLLKELAVSGIYDKPIAVEVLPRQTFYTAEDYHQDYAEKNPGHYGMYRKGSGREDFVNQVCQIRDEKKIVWKE